MNNSRIVKIFDSICLVIMFAMVIDVLLQVFFRFVLSISVPMTEELAKLLYSAMIFFSIVLCEAEDIQLKTTYFLDKLPFWPRLVVYIVTGVFSVAVLLSFFVGSFRMFQSSMGLTYGTMPWLPKSVEYVAPMISVPLALYCLVKRIFHIKEVTAEHLKEYEINLDEEEDA